MTKASPRRHYSGYCKVTEEEGDPRISGKKGSDRNVEGGFQIQLEEDGGGRIRQSRMEISGLWTVIYLERKGISQVGLGLSQVSIRSSQ